MVSLDYRSRRNAPLLGVADLFAHLLYLQQTGTMRHPVQQWSLEQLLLRERESRLTLFDASSMDTILRFVSRASPCLFDAASDPSRPFGNTARPSACRRVPP